jgi:hypothetical protein
MKMIYVITSGWLAMFAIACKNQVGEATSDSTVVSQVDTAQLPTATQDSIPNRGYLPITYQQIHDTLWGVRNGDTLQVEGDMLFIGTEIGEKAVGSNRLWDVSDGYINVPYLIDPSITFRPKLLQGIQLWKNRVKIRFVEKTNESSYVRFTKKGVAESEVGKKGYEQVTFLPDTASAGTIAHEIGHILGLFHEQGRSDRDNYVTIKCIYNINYGHALRGNVYAEDIGDYDYFSIMHYPSNNCLSVKKKDLPPGIPGQREKVSDGDVAGIKKMYKLK